MSARALGGGFQAKLKGSLSGRASSTLVTRLRCQRLGPKLGGWRQNNTSAMRGLREYKTNAMPSNRRTPFTFANSGTHVSLRAVCGPELRIQSRRTRCLERLSTPPQHKFCGGAGHASCSPLLHDHCRLLQLWLLEVRKHAATPRVWRCLYWRNKVTAGTEQTGMCRLRPRSDNASGRACADTLQNENRQIQDELTARPSGLRSLPVRAEERARQAGPASEV